MAVNRYHVPVFHVFPRLISSILALESGNGKRFSGNNPFGLGPGYHYKSPQLAIAEDAYTLNQHVYGKLVKQQWRAYIAEIWGSIQEDGMKK